MITDEATGWIGARLSRAQIAAILFIGTVGVTIAGVQPVLFGALLEAGRISIGQIGHAATAELVGLGLGVPLAGWLLGGRPVRGAGILAAMLLAAANLATLAVSGEGVILVRALAGLPGGMLLWISVAAIVRSPTPTVLSACSLLLQAFIQCLVATGIAVAVPGSVAGVPVAIAGLCLAAAALMPMVPPRFAPLPREETASGLPPARGWLVLATILLLQAAIVGAWVYMEPLGKQAGLSAQQIALATPLSLGAQVLGGLAAIAMARRVPWLVALTAASLLLAGVLLWMAQRPAPALFLALEVAFGALWTFISPYLTPFAIDNDPTRRTAELGPSATLIGSGLGPLAASAFATEQSAGQVLQLCAALAIGALVLVVGLFITLVAGRRNEPLARA